MSDLAALLAAKKRQLASGTVTRIRTATGALFEERLDPASGVRVRVATGHEVLPTYQRQAAAGFARLRAYAFDGARGKWVAVDDGDDGGGAPPVVATKTLVATATVPVTASSAAPPPPPPPAALSVVTYNVWFSDQHWAERAAGLLALLAALHPDVVCLQEVTPRFAHVFAADAFVRAHYYGSEDGRGTTCAPYGVTMWTRRTPSTTTTTTATATAAATTTTTTTTTTTAGAAGDAKAATATPPSAAAWPVPRFTIHALPSNMGRRFLRAVLPFGDGDAGGGAAGAGGGGGWLAVGTAHLESLDNAEYRTAQLRLILPLLCGPATAAPPSASAATAPAAASTAAATATTGDAKAAAAAGAPADDDAAAAVVPTAHALFLGDTNFGDADAAEQAALDAFRAFRDVQRTLHDQQHATAAAPPPPMPETGPGMGRIDKILVRSASYAPATFQLIGTAPLVFAGAPAGRPVRPSDHFGLHATFRWTPPATAAAAATTATTATTATAATATVVGGGAATTTTAAAAAAAPASVAAPATTAVAPAAPPAAASPAPATAAPRPSSSSPDCDLM